MKQKTGSKSTTSDRLVKNIQRKSRNIYSAEENIRIILDGLRGEMSIAELSRPASTATFTVTRHRDGFTTFLSPKCQ